MEKFHYYLLPTEIRYEIKGNSHTVKMDTLTKVSNPYISMKDMGQAQQASQVRFYHEFMKPSPDIIIKDVVILSVNYLGEMTEEEFTLAAPMPSDTKTEDKPAQNAVEGSPVVLGSSSQVQEEKPSENLTGNPTEKPVELVSEPKPDIVPQLELPPSEIPETPVPSPTPNPAEPSNEADKG